jgi:hypothetical protein
MSAHRDGVSHWDDVYAVGDASRSWFQTCPLMSLKMLDAAGVTASDSLIDVGGGASRLAGALLGPGIPGHHCAGHLRDGDAVRAGSSG